MAREWWIPIVQWTLWGVAMTVVMGWVARSRFGKRPASGADALAHPMSTLVIGVVGVLFFGGIAVVSNTIGKNHHLNLDHAVFRGIRAGRGAHDRELFFRAPSCLRPRHGLWRIFGQRGTSHWSDVTRVRYASMMKWFAIDLRSGSTSACPRCSWDCRSFPGCSSRTCPETPWTTKPICPCAKRNKAGRRASGNKLTEPIIH